MTTQLQLKTPKHTHTHTHVHWRFTVLQIAQMDRKLTMCDCPLGYTVMFACVCVFEAVDDVIHANMTSSPTSNEDNQI